MASKSLRDAAYHQGVSPAVTTFAKSRRLGTHWAHTDSRAKELSRFYRGVIGRFRHAVTLTSSPT